MLLSFKKRVLVNLQSIYARPSINYVCWNKSNICTPFPPCRHFNKRMTPPKQWMYDFLWPPSPFPAYILYGWLHTLSILLSQETNTYKLTKPFFKYINFWIKKCITKIQNLRYSLLYAFQKQFQRIPEVYFEILMDSKYTWNTSKNHFLDNFSIILIKLQLCKYTCLEYRTRLRKTEKTNTNQY